MFAKRMSIFLFTLLFIFSAFYFWSNILIIDDVHKKTHDSIECEYTLGNTFHILIDLDKLSMHVYKGEELLKTFPVSGGSKYTPSPLGNWVIIAKDTWGEGFGGAWLGLNVPWGEYGIHGTDCPWFIGKSNSSKGCIRMYNKDAKELFKLVPHGTTVTIVQENQPFRTMQNGDVGSDVKEIQVMLKEMGYYKGYPDGIFGQYLEKAVKDFQKDYKIWISGTVYKKAYDLIIQEASQYNSILY